MYPTLEKLNWPEIEREILSFWKENEIFQKSVEQNSKDHSFTFFEGPPSANGMPGIHHVMARAMKDIFCRYKTLQGYRVERKGGWDTHGLPIELQVEKRLGIRKDDIGEKISVADYNKECREDVLKFKDKWDDLTERIGFWLDLENPYITYENNYIETLWSLLKRLHDKGLLYKGYTIQPFSPAAGTGLSSHELNQPGTYQDVKDTTVVAQFKKVDKDNEFFIAWTTTPWTLPSNTALAVGAKIDYVDIQTFNIYTGDSIIVTLASALVSKYFNSENEKQNQQDLVYSKGEKNLPWLRLKKYTGRDLEGQRYEQLMPYAQPDNGDAFKVILGDFVSTEDGTGIVHIAPSFGADDFRVAQKNGMGSLTLVNKEGRFDKSVTDFAGEFVKAGYLTEEEKAEEAEKQGRDKYLSVDERIAIKLKTENRAFKVEKYEHSYPHCWRTDKPILYYPLESWFIKTTAVKDRLVELNKTINWKPQSTGTGRFGNWLENLVDWNLSRSRFWGTPLPIWRTEDNSEEKCIGSMDELVQEIEKANHALNLDQSIDKETFDLHRPFVDEITLVSKTGQPMKRENDLIDVWFDSGAMPYAQWHWPFENDGVFKENFPADFIAEGVDQTRGWFFTLHALGVMLFDSVAFKNVIANGLVLDKHGNKMSKRLKNTIDPFTTVEKFGADAVRWYMFTNSQPWDNLKFNLDGVQESQRKFLATLYNTYGFFAIYANIDEYHFNADREIPLAERTELDRWIVSKLNSLVQSVTDALEDYDPTKASRSIENFVDEHLSNWFVRLSRRRFWKGEMNTEKQAAYDTLFTCLDTLSRLSSPFAPFFADWLYRSLNHSQIGANRVKESVHLSQWPEVASEHINTQLEAQMSRAQQVCSLVLSLRKKENIKVRQPLNKILIPVLTDAMREEISHVSDIIKSEVNVKNIEFLGADDQTLVKQIKPNFKTLGKLLGPKMKLMAQEISKLQSNHIQTLEADGSLVIELDEATFELTLDHVEIKTQDMPGWLVASEGDVTVALDININNELRLEGIAREFVNRIQNLRKELGFDVTDRIKIEYQGDEEIIKSASLHHDYICNEVLANQFVHNEEITSNEVDVYEKNVFLHLTKV
ncbi:isoleucine--tRNA ligase [Bacteroidia bacterium]|jgi:isoleucyl-tRNA synthetase|nr:isoleucine--tRNA ligase [Bacteroidia bacterium]